MDYIGDPTNFIIAPCTKFRIMDSNLKLQIADPYLSFQKADSGE